MPELKRPHKRRRPLLFVLLVGLLVCGTVLLTAAWKGAWVSYDAQQQIAQNKRPAQTHADEGSDSRSSSSKASSAEGRAGEAVKQQAPPPPPDGPQPLPKKPLTPEIERRCAGTLGTWCVDFYTQGGVPARTAPQGNKTCSMDCNQVGTCSALSGLCTCTAGWQGFNCVVPRKRYCVHTYAHAGFERFPQGNELQLGLERESIWAFPQSRCSGFCDDTVAACYCPSNMTFGRIPAPVDSPQGSPPIQRGRPMNYVCQPDKMPDGRHTNWGSVDPELLFGKDGWCQSPNPKYNCDCYIDGWGGRHCDEPYEPFCFNQCNGRGDCDTGYCRCHEGWHGIDCAHQASYAGPAKPSLLEQRPWLKEHVHTPAAQQFAPDAVRKRPLIYVYELPTEYNTLMLQYRNYVDSCVPRLFSLNNGTITPSWTYGAESGFLEMLLQSEHRTLDPEEADFFYVPIFVCCFINPVRDAADSLHDFWYSVHFTRAQGATNMMLEAYHWVRSHHPYWDRRGGRDHIWLAAHDEASCYVPAVVRPSIILSHWGRMDANHTSGTGYGADNYDLEMSHPQFEPKGWRRKIAGFPCYDPGKDLVIPSLKTPAHFTDSPLAGAPTRNRTWLGFHRGRVQPENKPFSRGIRQRLAQLATEQNWKDKHGILVGEEGGIPGSYSALLASSVFCLVLPGDGWTARMEDAMLHGCIPAIIMDEVHVSFESVLDVGSYALRIPQADIDNLPAILQGVPEARRREMREALARVWQRYFYGSYRPYATAFKRIQQGNAQAAAAQAADQPLSQPATVPDLDPAADDAFTTIMAWLYSRIEHTRAPP